MTIVVTIAGKGIPEDIAHQLKRIAIDLQVGNYANDLRTKGVCFWEDENVNTTISKVKD